MEASFWSLLPPVLAIIISLLTKEVNISLLIGIIVGAGIYSRFNPFSTLTTIFDVMSSKVYGNLGVIVFIILLGMIVYLMNLSGATNKYAQWARKRLKTKKQTLIATILLGIIIFVDDYFSCLTSGTVMKPIIDKNKVSREKLAYIIDLTAAPICIVAPISSWAAAVSSSLPSDSSIDGFSLFVKSIPGNYYTWLSLTLVLFTTILNVDFGKMRYYDKHSYVDTDMVDDLDNDTNIKKEISENVGVIDLILPVGFLILFSIISMLYTGGFFNQEGTITFSQALAECDAILGLAMGATYTVIFMALLYIPRKIVTPKVFVNALVEGFKNMVPATLILTFAWTLSGICGAEYLNTGGFVTSIVEKYNVSLTLMPSIFFIVAFLLAFSTGTSWGTFSILLPITISVFSNQLTPLVTITTAAVLGGSVCGDHLSPISDTTILSSTSSGCNHINHVSTQLEYGLLTAIISFVCYLISGFTKNVWLGLAFGVIGIILMLLLMKIYYKN